MAPIIFAVIAVVLGLLTALVPAHHILKMDRRIGYRIYINKLEKTNDVKKALSAAGMYYKVVGFLFVLVGIARFYNAIS